MFDEIMDVKLVNGVFTSDTGKQFSTGMFKKKILWMAIVIFQRLFWSNFDIVLSIMIAHNLGIHTKSLYKLVSAAKGKLFVSY